MYIAIACAALAALITMKMRRRRVWASFVGPIVACSVGLAALLGLELMGMTLDKAQALRTIVEIIVLSLAGTVIGFSLKPDAATITLGVTTVMVVVALLATLVAYEPMPTSGQEVSSPVQQGDWTMELTGRTDPGSWLDQAPTGTRFCRLHDRQIVKVFPPGVLPNAEKANPFCVMESVPSPTLL